MSRKARKHVECALGITYIRVHGEAGRIPHSTPPSSTSLLTLFTQLTYPSPFIMKLALAVSAVFAAVVLAAPTEQVCDNGLNCYASVHEWGGVIQYEPYQGNLMDACRYNDGAVGGIIGGTGNLWGYKACVAVAISDTKIGPFTVQGLASCENKNLTCEWEEPNLDFNLYASIVGECAWDNGCPITQQNYIDFIYGTLSEIGSSDWPSSVDTLLENGWRALLDWAKTGDTIPYQNLNDYLHYS
ncbi:hypothetical protein EV714DRAFT_279541 [Schizophyllum commune]